MSEKYPIGSYWVIGLESGLHFAGPFAERDQAAGWIAVWAEGVAAEFRDDLVVAEVVRIPAGVDAATV